MEAIRVCLFGTPRVERLRAGGAPEPLRLPNKVQALLAWLLVHPPHPHPRERMADDLWGDQGPERATSCLSTALWRLRQILEPEGEVARGSWIVAAGGDVGLNWESPLWLDVQVVERAAARALAQPAASLLPADADTLESALALCTADLLDGYYDDWALRRREALRRTHLNSMALLMRFHRSAGRPRQSAAFAHALLEHDPLREEIHRTLMALYVEMGQAPDALRQYELCAQVLARDLGIPPMPETQELHRRIVTGEPLEGPARALSAGLSGELPAAIAHDLQAALVACDEARSRVLAALDALEHVFLHRLH